MSKVLPFAWASTDQIRNDMSIKIMIIDFNPLHKIEGHKSI